MEQSQNQTIEHVAVIGLGLIGASFAAAFMQAHPTGELLGVDIDAASCETALERGWATAVAAPGSDGAKSFICGPCELVVLATPASAARHYLEELVVWGYKGLITDTCSTKAPICADAEAVLPDPAQFLPGHPMAGSEVNGIKGARPDLFEGMHWILCPDENTLPEDYTRVHDLLKTIKARVISLPREEHDRYMAVVSHVPHMVAASLVDLADRHANGQQVLFRLAAGGFKDSTRIAAGSPELWCGIAFDNKDAIIDGLAEVRDIIGQFQAALEDDDRARMTGLLREASKARRAIPKKWVPDTDNLLEIRVPMENHNGAVAQITAIASKEGCNIDSIEIDHITAHSAVLDMVLTDEGDVGKLSTALIRAGYTVYLAPLTAKE